MKKSKLIYTVIAAALLAGAIGASAQSDSSNVPALRGNPVVGLTLQERETPMINYITQVTQTIQPNTYVASGGGSGYNSAGASADCGGGGVMLSGGGSCTNGQGLVAVASSQPNGNGWYLSCGAGFQDGPVNATAYAVCSMR